jgi:hypothetical protein
MMVRRDEAVERLEKITTRALQLQCAAQRLFQRLERVQRNSFQHAIVRFRLPEKRTAQRPSRKLLRPLQSLARKTMPFEIPGSPG